MSCYTLTIVFLIASALSAWAGGDEDAQRCATAGSGDPDAALAFCTAASRRVARPNPDTGVPRPSPILAWAGIFAGITGSAKVRDKLRPRLAHCDAFIPDRAEHPRPSKARTGHPRTTSTVTNSPDPRHGWAGHPPGRSGFLPDRSPP